MPQTVLLNLFPANVTVGTAVYRGVRVTVTPTKATVWAMVGGEIMGIQESYVLQLDKPQRRRRGLDPDYTLSTTTDGTWEIRKAGGCGCGSKLRSFNPFGGANRVGT